MVLIEEAGRQALGCVGERRGASFLTCVEIIFEHGGSSFTNKKTNSKHTKSIRRQDTLGFEPRTVTSKATVLTNYTMRLFVEGYWVTHARLRNKKSSQLLVVVRVDGEAHMEFFNS